MLNNDEYEDINAYIKSAQNGDKEAEEFLIKNNTRLIWSIIRRFQNRGYEMEDLYQVGALGLVKAIKKFNCDFNVKFSTYAVPMIMGEVKRFIRDDGIIKVSRSIKDIVSKAKQARYSLNIELQREPTIKEIAAKLGIEVEELVVAMDSENAPESIYETVHEGDSSNILLIDKLDSSREGEKDIIERITLKEVISKLEIKERQIVIMRYFQDRTQGEVAKVLGISQVQVSRIEKKILEKIRKNLE